MLKTNIQTKSLVWWNPYVGKFFVSNWSKTNSRKIHFRKKTFYVRFKTWSCKKNSEQPSSIKIFEGLRNPVQNILFESIISWSYLFYVGGFIICQSGQSFKSWNSSSQIGLKVAALVPEVGFNFLRLFLAIQKHLVSSVMSAAISSNGIFKIWWSLIRNRAVPLVKNYRSFRFN